MLLQGPELLGEFPVRCRSSCRCGTLPCSRFALGDQLGVPGSESPHPGYRSARLRNLDRSILLTQQMGEVVKPRNRDHQADGDLAQPVLGSDQPVDQLADADPLWLPGPVDPREQLRRAGQFCLEEPLQVLFPPIDDRQRIGQCGVSFRRDPLRRHRSHPAMNP